MASSRFEPTNEVHELEGYVVQPALAEVHNSRAQHRIVVGGRRFGKTVFAIADLAIGANSCSPDVVKKFGGSLICPYIGPLFKQARRIAWSRLKNMLDPYRAHKVPPNETRMEIKLWNGMWVMILGADQPETLEGNPFWRGVMDEYGAMGARVWTDSIEPSTTDASLCDNGGGRFLFIGKPLPGHFQKLVAQAKTCQDGQWAVWIFPSWFSRYANFTKLQQVKERLITCGDGATWDREYAAKFVAATGRIYPAFDPEVHVHPFGDWKFQPEWDVAVGVDPGASNPTAALVCGIDQMGRIWVGHEHYSGATHTGDDGVKYHGHAMPISEHSKRIKALIAEASVAGCRYRGGMMDPAARQLFTEFAQHGLHLGPANNDVQAGIARIRELLAVDRATGMPGLIVHPRCVHTIDEMLRYRFKEQKAEDRNAWEQPYKFDDHCPDALRYLAMARYRAMDRSRTVEECSMEAMVRRCVERDMKAASSRVERDDLIDPQIGGWA